MDRQKRILYYCLNSFFILLFLVILVKGFPVYAAVLFFIGKIIFPFLVAAFIAYLLSPLVSFLERYKLKKTIAIILIYIVAAIFLSIIIYQSVPVMIRELEELSKQLPQLVNQYEHMLHQMYQATAFLPETIQTKVDHVLSHLAEEGDQKVTKALDGLVHGTDMIVILAAIPVLVFYYLKDYSTIKQWLQSIVRPRHHERMERILLAIDESLGGYVRGQVLLSSVITAAAYVVYYMLDLKYALLLAIVMGAMNVIPYFGPIIGTIPAALIALTMSFRLFLFVILFNLLIQLLESSLLSPYIMGKHVHIHPIVLIFTLLAGAEFGGIIGMIIAVPTVTILRGVYKQLRHPPVASD